jgi:hypothetical protein
MPAPVIICPLAKIATVNPISKYYNLFHFFIFIIWITVFLLLLMPAYRQLGAVASLTNVRTSDKVIKFPQNRPRENALTFVKLLVSGSCTG